MTRPVLLNQPDTRPVLKPFKFLVQAVMLATDQAGNVIGEVRTEPETVYGTEALAEWAEGFPAALEGMQAHGGADEPE